MDAADPAINDIPVMTPRIVVKVGGSLFYQKDLPERLNDLFCSRLVDHQVNLLFGGGPVVDALRDLDAVHTFEQIKMHWRCIQMLKVSFELAQEWLPSATAIASPREFQQHQKCIHRGLFLHSTEAFYSPVDSDRLPLSWATTSDSIAAFLADKLAIEHLLLLKACEVPQGLSVEQAAVLGMVDQTLPGICKSIRVELLKL